MPTYQYECENCEYSFEQSQSMTEKRLSKCPKCGKNKLARLIGSGSGIIFKGSGFYETDYKQKGSAKVEKTPSSVKKEPALKGGSCCPGCPASCPR
jgi:putative FmdB family regulatory protein